MDAFQHVNNTVYLRWFESARIACFERTGFDAHMRAHRVGPILAETSCRFRRPLAYPDRVIAGTRISDLGDDRFTMEYAVWSHALGEVAATGTGLVVCYDYAAARRCPLPDAIRAALAALRA
ncbi:MAG: acyl-CoA thioesterase [Deltaproteobacteria bacterium]|nr:acyl-CoA thioesterase [Deltaproteobacteria bacterium]